MGRRLLLILGIVLSASSTASVGRGQEEAQKPAPPEPTPVVFPTPPATFPQDLAPPPIPRGAESGETAAPPPATPQEPKKPTTKTDVPKDKNASPQEDEPQPGGPSGKEEHLGLRSDEGVVLTQAPAASPERPPGTSVPGGGAGGTATPSATVDRLPLGKQSVAVTVDVQAPANMNLGQEATLKLIVRNTGTSDALNVDIQDELPEGLQYISSQPDMTVAADSHLSYRIPTLQAGSEKVLTLRVKPTRAVPFDHAATVRFETGCKSRTRVLEPKLKVDVVASPTNGKVLKGQVVEFKVSIQNTGSGPARNVAIQAKLSAGLRHESGQHSEDPMVYELTLPELAPGAVEKLDPLVADAIVGGEQSCNVVAKSPDVVSNKDDNEVTKVIAVVEPKVKLTLKAPDSRYTDTVADYEITVENPGTASARKIRVVATLPVNGRLVSSPNGRYDSTTRRLSWTIDQLDANAKPVTFPFQIRMGGIGLYQVVAEATGDGGLNTRDRRSTEVIGMPDVDLVVSEAKRVLDVGGTTTFQIRLRNYGTKEATNLQVTANLSKNLKVEKAGGGPKDVKVAMTTEQDAVKFDEIAKLGPGKEMTLSVLVRVVAEDPKLATCRVVLTHDDMSDRFEDMAAVKVTSTRRTAAALNQP
jgi:uncharacterized repeat protein (TIGR01451 family)